MKKIILLLMSVVMLASCHSSKKAAEKAQGDIRQQVETKADEWVYDTNFTSKVKVGVNVDGKSVSTTGSFRMRKDDVIQVTLVDPYLGVMEVGRMEVSPNEILVIDRVNKRYMSEDYKTISKLAGTEITFDMIQKLFWVEANNPANNGNFSLTIPLKTPVALSFKLTNIGNEKEWEGHTKVSSKYQKVTLDSIFNTLVNNE